VGLIAGSPDLLGRHAAAQRYLAAAFLRAHPSLDLPTVIDPQLPGITRFGILRHLDVLETGEPLALA
jgi:hypothetical protein